MKKKPQQSSEIIMSVTEKADCCHELISFWSHGETERKSILAGMVALCFGGMDNQKSFSRAFIHASQQDVLRLENLDKFLIRNIPTAYLRMDSYCGEESEDPAYHSSCGFEKVVVKQQDTWALTHECHCAFLVDCTLERTNRAKRSVSKMSSKSFFDDTVVHIRTSKAMMEDKNDMLFRDLIIVLPFAGVFYTTSMTNNGFSRRYVPLPWTWLRLRHDNGKPAAGAFVRHIHRCLSIDWGKNRLNNVENPTLAYHCYQMNDAETGTPLLPPDVYLASRKPISWRKCSLNNHALRVKYRKLLEDSPSQRYGCRRYVIGALHQNSGDGCLRYDQRIDGDATFYITTRTIHGRPESISVLKVTALDDRMFGGLSSLMRKATCTYTSHARMRRGNARANRGDKGGMTVTGMLSCKETKSLVMSDTIIKHDHGFYHTLPKICRGVRRFSETTCQSDECHTL